MMLNPQRNSLWQAPRILVIVYDHGIRDAVMDAIAGEYYELRAMAHGDDALSLSSQWRPSVILLDLRLPATDGGASMTRYRCAAGPGVAIIGLAGFPVGDMAALAAQAGADAGLAMPLDTAALRALVHQHVTRERTVSPAPVTPPATEVDGEATNGSLPASRATRAAIVDALRTFAAQSARNTPWMAAAALTHSVGATRN